MLGIIKGSIEYCGIAESFPKNLSCFKELTIQDKLVVPKIKPNVQQVIKMMVEVNVTETTIIRTPVTKSYEGNILTGWKLIVQGELLEKIEYISDELTGSVHALQLNVPFSTYVVLPKSFREGEKVDVNPYIEDIHIHQIDKKELFNSVNLLLEVTWCYL